MHIADGILDAPVLIGGAVAAGGALVLSLRRLDADAVPRVGLLGAAFFVASLISVPIGPAHAHLLLLGLTGLMLGGAAVPAIAAALALQSLLFGYGGLTALGVNITTMAGAAVCAGLLCRRGLRHNATAGGAAAWGFAAGALGVVLAAALTAAALVLSGEEFLPAAQLLLAGHLPVMVIEGFVTAAAVGFLRKARPDLLTIRRRAHA